jgi:hypothetical protein
VRASSAPAASPTAPAAKAVPQLAAHPAALFPGVHLFRLQRSAAQPAPCDAAKLQPALPPGVPALRLQRSRASSPSLQPSCSQRFLQEYQLSKTAAQRSEPAASAFSRSTSSQTAAQPSQQPQPAGKLQPAHSPGVSLTDCSAAQRACSQRFLQECQL